MRVIAGEARGRRLRVPGVPGLRPTGDRARESLFNVLRERLPGARVLDLFAGSGALGIEALSRGAAFCDFVERDGRAREAIRDNLERCGFAERAEVHGGDWRAALRRLRERETRYDVILADPPWDWKGAHRLLDAVRDLELLAGSGLTVVEHRKATPPDDVEGWCLYRLLEVGDTAFSMFERSAV